MSKETLQFIRFTCLVAVRDFLIKFQRTTAVLHQKLDEDVHGFFWRKLISMLSYTLDIMDHKVQRKLMESPFLTTEIEEQMSWRDGDIVVSSSFKGGTTWTMNIAYQCREGGRSDFRDIYEEVPWTEFKITPKHTIEGHLKYLNGLPLDKRRIFKTHSYPSTLPFHEKVKYVVVFRNPEEAAISAYPFVNSHNDKFLGMWGFPEGFSRFDDFESYYYGFHRPTNRLASNFYGIKYWWPLRHKPNVLMIHFSDMKKDHEGHIRKVSEFLGFENSEEQMERILEYTSFTWMRAHKEKFELNSFFDYPFLVNGHWVRQGSSGLQEKEGMSKEISLDISNTAKEILGSNEDAINWIYNGGLVK